MAVTLRDIALASGVSRGTVDRALNGKGRISPQTKEKIITIANEMGYKPDLIARSLVKGRSMSIGVIVFDILNQYFSQMVNAIGVEARNSGYSMEFMMQEKSKELEITLIDTLIGRRTDGIILCPVNKGLDFSAYLSTLPMPVVVVGNKLDDNLPFFGMDEYAAAKDATRMIADKGYERIVLICPSLNDTATENIFVHEERRRGFMEAVTARGLTNYEIIDHWAYTKAAHACLLRDKLRTAFFCSGDIFALELVNYLKEHGLVAPMDFGIMGFDGIDVLRYVSPRIATVCSPIEAIGVAAFEGIVSLVKKEAVAKQRLLPYSISEGESL